MLGFEEKLGGPDALFRTPGHDTVFCVSVIPKFPKYKPVMARCAGSASGPPIFLPTGTRGVVCEAVTVSCAEKRLGGPHALSLHSDRALARRTMTKRFGWRVTHEDD